MRCFIGCTKECGSRLKGKCSTSTLRRPASRLPSGEKKIQAMLHLDWGSIHIGSSDMIMHAFLLPYLERFHKDYPKVRISTITASTPETIASLRARRIDLGVVFSPVEELSYGRSASTSSTQIPRTSFNFPGYSPKCSGHFHQQVQTLPSSQVYFLSNKFC